MPKKDSGLTSTDQFCGAGGSSQAARKAGIKVRLALNHWRLAIDTHNTNFPDTDHDCTDISAADPRRYPSTDILITSPECTNHSLAKGVKIVKKQLGLYEKGILDPAAERSRATMWDVPRFAEYHNYNAIIVENVVDARKWVMFDAWLMAMHSLGYMHRCVYLNSMHAHPTPQSRDRMYVVFWKKGNKAPELDYTPPARCGRCEKDVLSVQTWKRPDIRFGKYRTQYVYACPSCATIVEPYYYASFNCIDWSDIGTRIGDREKKLSPKTITRIEYGIEKYGQIPFQVVNYSPGYTKPLTDPTAAITCQDHHGIFTPFLLKLEHAGNLRSVADAANSQTTRQSSMLVRSIRGVGREMPTQTTCQGFGIAMPFMVVNKGKSLTRPITDPAASQTTVPSLGIAIPFIAEARGTGKARSTAQALGAVTAGGNHHGLVTTDSWNSFIASYNSGSNCTKHISEETGTVTGIERLSLVNYKQPAIEDCYYRMLKPPEIQIAMAFEENYVVLGNSREKVKQLGNAVTPPPMEFLITQVKKSLS